MHPGITAPDMKDVTPQVQAVLMGMQTQLQQSQQQIMQLTKALTDQQADRALKAEDLQTKRDKVNKDFEARLLTLYSKMMEETRSFHANEIEREFHRVQTLVEGPSGGRSPALSGNGSGRATH